MTDEIPLEVVQAEFEAAIDLAKKVKEDVDFPIADHVAKDEEDVCGYCGQCFGPDDIVVERVLYGRKWHFCDEQCMRDFMEHSNFKDQDLDADIDVRIGDQED